MIFLFVSSVFSFGFFFFADFDLVAAFVVFVCSVRLVLELVTGVAGVSWLS